VKRVALVILLLAMLGMAACGDDQPESAVEVPAWAKVAPEQIADAKEHGVPVAFENDLGMRFVLIPSGTFLMGSPVGVTPGKREIPQHEVTISQPYYMQVMEIRNETFRRMRPEHDPGVWGNQRDAGSAPLNRTRQPASNISWNDAVSFAAWLTQQDKARGYRLPTEAEWEYGCRAGTATAYAFGDNLRHDQAAFRPSHVLDPRHLVSLVDVGSFPPNAWGLFDMHGNAGEWCADWYGPYTERAVVDPMGPDEGTRKIIRSGWSGKEYVQSAVRGAAPPDYEQKGSSLTGFRLVSPLPAQ